MNDKELMIENFNETQNFIKNNQSLLNSISKSIQNTTIYKEDYVFDIDSNAMKYQTKYIVQNKRTLAALALFSENIKNPCVLNFASATNPGGGVLRGSLAQEECICRCSVLYNVLSNKKFFQDFYKYHRDLHNTLYTNRIIYSPDIIIINEDKQTPIALEQNEWGICNIISCAAPNLRELSVSEKEIFEILKERIRRICLVAIENHNDGIVLGAFGCGAFRNNPNIVARAFETILIEEKYGEYFKEVVMAVYDTPNNNMVNYNTFKRVFKKYE